MPRMSKIELYAAIQCGHRGGMSMRELERVLGGCGARAGLGTEILGALQTDGFGFLDELEFAWKPRIRLSR
ncbi:hypothetical protein ACFVFH_34655 [Streptomyces sp. NPDC057697]|uniref:hypothetical protein n=1 Tax=Streptomyces sp. NPDC057697 TaxID=3346219 RepID=UPI0036BC511E